MKKIHKYIEIVRSSEPGLSSMGKKTARAICEVLEQKYSHVRITIVNNLNDLEDLSARKPDLVFMGMKFIPMNPGLGFNDPQKIWLNQYLSVHGIPSTGSGYEAYELEFDKGKAKQRVQRAGLSTSPFYVIQAGKEASTEVNELSYPLFIKPTNLGGGKGIDDNSIAYDFTALESKISSLAVDLGADALIEQYLSGREFSVALLKYELSNDYMTMPLELIAPANARGERLLSAKIKSGDKEKFVAVTDPIIFENITSLALDSFLALGGRDYGRIDIRLDQFGTPHFLEANLVPSMMIGYGNFPKACKLVMGIGYEEMIQHITRLGLDRATTEIIEEPVLIGGFSIPVVAT